MKILTIKQPWATLIALGLKNYEFRSWKTNYRGEFLIHAGKTVDKQALTRFKHLNLEYPTSKILAKCNLVDCIELNPIINEQICNESYVYGTDLNRTGYAWKLENVNSIECDDVINGKLGLWNIERDDL